MKILLLISLAVIFYKRYIPVLGVHHTDSNKVNAADVTIIDIRNFNVSTKNPIDGAINLPVAYLHRHFREINDCLLHVVAANALEKMLGFASCRKKVLGSVGIL
ncbi:hypothetical protein [Mesobacillus foraminis]|uniref:hypothetical protein n=1 Tax=Mesobacillus foraminis TaxID=279826 RepID=UPI00214BAD58|nr:hypothetical protein [Mesobacillus foraminis]